MKIAMPVENNSKENSINISFGRTEYFLIYDDKTKEITYLENTAASSQGGAGIKAAQLIVDSGAKVLITPRCGENAFEVLDVAGIKIYKTNGNDPQKNIDFFNNDELLQLQEIHKGHHHGGQN